MLTWVERRWAVPLLALLAGMAALALLGIDLPRARLLSPYCAGTAPVRKVIVEAKKGEFVPAEINVAKGDCIELWIRATDGIAHSAAIEDSDISSEGAPLFDHHGRYHGRAMRRENPQLSPVMLKEGWFAKGEQVRLRFQAMKVGDYRLRCNAAESLSESGLTPAHAMSARISVSE
jgi:plastocyanin